jgi:hypothetical protein
MCWRPGVPKPVGFHLSFIHLVIESANPIMKTPAGIECKYFYGDYFRGRNVEECRLLKAAGESWSPELCKTCPVPGIARANACDFLQLRATVGRPISAVFMRRVQITAYCDKTRRDVKEPHVGCGECHPLPPIFDLKK